MFNISHALQYKHVPPVLHGILSLPKLIWQRLLWNRCQSYVVTSCSLEDSNLGWDAAALGQYCLLLHGQSSCLFLQQFILLVPFDSWRHRQNDSLQCKELLTHWHSITSQTVCTFSNTAVRTSNLSSIFRFKARHSFKKVVPVNKDHVPHKREVPYKNEHCFNDLRPYFHKTVL